MVGSRPRPSTKSGARPRRARHSQPAGSMRRSRPCSGGASRRYRKGARGRPAGRDRWEKSRWIVLSPASRQVHAAPRRSRPYAPCSSAGGSCRSCSGPPCSRSPRSLPPPAGGRQGGKSRLIRGAREEGRRDDAHNHSLPVSGLARDDATAVWQSGNRCLDRKLGQRALAGGRTISMSGCGGERPGGCVGRAVPSAGAAGAGRIRPSTGPVPARGPSSSCRRPDDS